MGLLGLGWSLLDTIHTVYLESVQFTKEYAQKAARRWTSWPEVPMTLESIIVRQALIRDQSPDHTSRRRSVVMYDNADPFICARVPCIALTWVCAMCSRRKHALLDHTYLSTEEMKHLLQSLRRPGYVETFWSGPWAATSGQSGRHGEGCRRRHPFLILLSTCRLKAQTPSNGRFSLCYPGASYHHAFLQLFIHIWSIVLGTL